MNKCIQSMLCIRPLFVSILLISATASCSSSSRQAAAPEGWIDENTYQLRAEGIPNTRLTSLTLRQSSAKRAAIANAQYQIETRLMSSVIDYYALVDDYCIPTRLPAMVIGIIKGGTIVYEHCDDAGTCRILYRISYPGLRKLSSPPFDCR